MGSSACLRRLAADHDGYLPRSMQAHALPIRRLLATVTAVVMLASTATASGAARPAECASRHLRVSEEKGQGAAGTFIFGLSYRNSGQRSCSVLGFPGVTLYGARHRQLAVAKRFTRIAHQVTIKPGQRAYGAITWGGTPLGKAQSCPRVNLLRVYPPDNRSPISVRIHGAGWYCGDARVYPIAASQRASFDPPS